MTDDEKGRDTSRADDTESPEIGAKAHHRRTSEKTRDENEPDEGMEFGDEIEER